MVRQILFPLIAISQSSDLRTEQLEPCFYMADAEPGSKYTHFHRFVTLNLSHKDLDMQIMRTVRLRGKAVDPLKIPIQIVDPDTYADGFREGVHYVPDTIDYIRDIGHLAETEEELIGERLDNLPSATLDEEFADSADSTLDELNDLEDGPAMEGMNAVVGGEEAALLEEDN